ncbi:hypothetical protein T12_6856, partial [Trichinella patagoniensis]
TQRERERERAATAYSRSVERSRVILDHQKGCVYYSESKRGRGRKVNTFYMQFICNEGAVTGESNRDGDLPASCNGKHCCEYNAKSTTITAIRLTFALNVTQARQADRNTHFTERRCKQLTTQ